MSATSDQVRKMFGEGDAIRDAGLTTPKNVQRFDNIVYGRNKTWNVLDVYRPKAKTGKLPVIISVHGGGWVYGDKEVYQFYCMSLAQRGFAVVNFTYRLAPEYKFPASLEDTNSVVKWVLKNGEEYGFDTDNIFAVGDSAGAHNLGLYANILTNPDYAKKYAFKAPKKFRFKAIALNCGAFKIELGKKEDLTTMLMADYLPKKGSKEEMKMISVAENMTADFPPVFVMTAVDDFLKDQPAYILPLLMKYEIPHLFRYYGTKDNRLAHVFHCNMRLKDAKICNDDECNFFKTFIEK